MHRQALPRYPPCSFWPKGLSQYLSPANLEDMSSRGSSLAFRSKLSSRAPSPPVIRNWLDVGTDGVIQLAVAFKHRPDYNTTGRPTQLAINVYQAFLQADKRVYQYDVIIGRGDEKRAVVRKVWESRARREVTGPEIIFDGNKLAWSTKDLAEIRKMVDLDAEEGRQGGRADNTFRLFIKKTKNLDVSILQSHLDGKIGFNNQVLEAINFVDHVLREGPSQNISRLIKVKRSFFPRTGDRQPLGGGIEACKGVYQSLRLAEGKKLVINLDVSNTCFWVPGSLETAIVQKFGLRDIHAIAGRMTSQPGNGTPRKTDFHRLVEKTMNKVNVTANFKGNPFPHREWNIRSFSLETARTHMIQWKTPETKKGEGPMITLEQYFQRKYNVALRGANLPLVEMTKKGIVYPMEFLQIIPGQRYPFKLDEKQTANMIKFAVNPPRVRLQSINNGKTALDWANDRYLREYGLKINQQNLKTNARILPPPSIEFGGTGGKKIERPGTFGRWDLRGKLFLLPNPTDLVSWGIGVFPGKIRPDKAQIDKFANDFMRAYRVHGGKVTNRPPHVMQLAADPAVGAEQLHQGTGNAFQQRPQMLVFLLQDRNAFHYQRLKKSCECRYGVVSQCMQIAQALKGSPQYYSNVLMKFNAKLGGTTARSISDPLSGFKGMSKPTMFVGADVSHASPGSDQASMAAITVSFDKIAARYAAVCQTNGRRVEMITQANMNNMLGPLVKQWQATAGGGMLPQQVYYMRDGVSEGQFVTLIRQEVAYIREVLGKCNNNQAWAGTMTVIVASKRHHVRMFPQEGGPDADKKGNPLPGTIVERDVTSPNEWDFFLNSHVALQGTARPVHYTVLEDTANHTSNQLQNMIYEHCYQYMRSTTAVSLHPAVYYAHLASMRARAHENIPSSAGPQGGPGYKQNLRPSESSSTSEPPPLISLYSETGIRWAMWYI